MELLTPREKKTIALKHRIMLTVDRLFTGYGVKALTMGNIAEEGGFSVGALQHHYGSKEHILYEYGLAVFDKFFDERKEQLQKAAEQDAIRGIVYPVALYAAYCELMGKDFIREAYSFDKDMFYDRCFAGYVAPLIEAGAQSGRLWAAPADIQKIKEDIVVIYRGIVLLWSTDTNSAFPESLDRMLLRILTKFLHEERVVDSDTIEDDFGWSAKVREEALKEAAEHGGFLSSSGEE